MEATINTQVTGPLSSDILKHAQSCQTEINSVNSVDLNNLGHGAYCLDYIIIKIEEIMDFKITQSNSKPQTFQKVRCSDQFRSDIFIVSILIFIIVNSSDQ